MERSRLATHARARTALRRGAALCLAAGAAAAALAPQAGAADADLTGRWDLDVAQQVPDGGGASHWEFADSSGNGATAMGYSTPTTTTGKWGNALKFGGASKAIAAPGAGAASTGLEPNEGTLSLWFRYAVAQPDEVKYLVSKGAPVSCENSSYAIYTGFDGTPPQPNNRGLQGYIFDGADTAYSQRAPNSVFDGTWHAVALVFKDGFVRLTVDGKNLGTRGVYPFNNPAGQINHPRYDDAVFSIGDNASKSCGDQSFNGSIDEVRFYKRALSDAELTRLHDGTSATPPNAEAPPVAPPADPDLDGDGFPGSKDCNDASPQIKPDAAEIKGNGVDDNCDGVSDPFGSISVNPVLSWDLLRSGRTKLRSLAIEGVRDGDTVAVLCKGGGCPKRPAKPVALAKVKKARARISGISKLNLKPKATLAVTVSRPDHVARVFTYTMKRRKNPSRVARCQNPGDSNTFAC